MRRLVWLMLAVWLGPWGVGRGLAQQAGAAPWAAVERVLGRAGQAGPEGSIRFGFPRTDLAVTLGQVKVRPALALGSWVAFRPLTGARALAMGDLVLTQGEVAPVLTALMDGGVYATALHNHLLGESPRLVYMHIEGEGQATALAGTVRDALRHSRTPLGPVAAPTAAPIGLDTAVIAAALGRQGRVAGGVYQVSVPRAQPVQAHGVEIPPPMGVATGINLQPTGAGRAAIAGDFVLAGDEVIPVMRALRQHGIQITALHSHMVGEEPRLYFMHFWADANAVALARGLRAALELTASKSP